MCLRVSKWRMERKMSKFFLKVKISMKLFLRAATAFVSAVTTPVYAHKRKGLPDWKEQGFFPLTRVRLEKKKKRWFFLYRPSIWLNCCKNISPSSFLLQPPFESIEVAGVWCPGSAAAAATAVADDGLSFHSQRDKARVLNPFRWLLLYGREPA